MSAHRIAADEVDRIVAPVPGSVSVSGMDCEAFHERAVAQHGMAASYGWTKSASGLVRAAPRRGAHRKKRPRKPAPGADAAPGRLAAFVAAGVGSLD